jgi:ribosome-associated protein
MSNFCDFFILLTASSGRRAQAIIDNIQAGLKEEGIPVKTQEGDEGSPWIALDLFDVVVHIFSQNARELYNLDRLWADAPVVTFPAGSNVRKRTHIRKPFASTARKVAARKNRA